MSERESTNATEPIVVLVAEDDPLNRLVARRVIIQVTSAATVVIAEDGLRALEAYKSSAPSLIFMDLQMPGKDGFEVTQEIRAAERDGTRVPIIALSGANEASERDRCLACGMDDFISKPLSFEIVDQVFKRWLT